ncbi:MAG: hypothetical protein AAGK00_03145 [Pseudomonadota bacterium]
MTEATEYKPEDRQLLSDEELDAVSAGRKLSTKKIRKKCKGTGTFK